MHLVKRWWATLLERVEPVLDDPDLDQASNLHDLERRMREHDRRPWRRDIVHGDGEPPHAGGASRRPAPVAVFALIVPALQGRHDPQAIRRADVSHLPR